VGSILVDVLMYIDHLPERGGDCLARHALLTSGGGYNVLVGAARLGLPVCHAGRVGTGPMGTQVMRDLQAAGIPLALPQVQGEDTGFDVGLVEEDAERTFVTSPGTEARLLPADVQAIALQGGDAVYVSGYDLGYPVSGTTLEAWLPSLPSACLLVVDPGPLITDIPVERRARVLARTNILTLNAREIRALTHTESLPTAAQQAAQELAAGGLVVARAGEEGCWLARADQPPLHIPGRSTHVVDTTGAGDAHTAALLARLAAGDELRTAARIANIAASIAIERQGPATGPGLAELQRVIATEITGLT
jgi:sugar/nucleoside kinase (ribokinase family)